MEVANLGSPFLIVLMVCVDVKQHCLLGLFVCISPGEHKMFQHKMTCCIRKMCFDCPQVRVVDNVKIQLRILKWQHLNGE